MIWPHPTARATRLGLSPDRRACRLCCRVFITKNKRRQFCSRNCASKHAFKRQQFSTRELYLERLDSVVEYVHKIDGRRNTYYQRFCRSDISDLHARVSRGLSIYAPTREELYGVRANTADNLLLVST